MNNPENYVTASSMKSIRFEKAMASKNIGEKNNKNDAWNFRLISALTSKPL